MFGCTKCGACCRKVNLAVKNSHMLTMMFGIAEEDLKFPYEWDENGVCEKLIDNKCSVYEERPLMCNIDKIRMFTDIEQHEFYEITAEGCHELMRAEGIYEKYNIKELFLNNQTK